MIVLHKDKMLVEQDCDFCNYTASASFRPGIKKS